MKEACLIEPANWMTWFEGVGGSLEESKVRSLIPTNTNVNVKKQVDRSWRCLLLNIGIDLVSWPGRCVAWVLPLQNWVGVRGRSLQKTVDILRVNSYYRVLTMVRCRVHMLNDF